MNEIRVLGIIAPHPPVMVEAVGGVDAEKTEASSRAMREAADALERFAPDTVIVMSPHSPALSNGFAIDSAQHHEGDLGRFGAPRPHLEYEGDPGFAAALLAALSEAGLPAVDRTDSQRLASGQLDHGVVVPMSFLDPDGRWPLVTISLSGLDLAAHRTLGETIARTAAAIGRRIAFVASGDLSHRLTPDAPAGYDPAAKRFDALLVDLISKADLDGLSAIDSDLADKAGECGLRTFVALSGLIPRPRTRVLAYEAPWGVGYLTALVADGNTFEKLDLGTAVTGSKHGAPGQDGHEIVSLARAAVESFVRERTRMSAPVLQDPELPGRAGVFVTLYMDGSLRGCIGTIVPTRDTLAEEVVNNAIHAATADSRFRPVSEDELDRLEVKVDVLREPERCDPADLDPARYGVIVSARDRQGLLLPDLVGVDTVEDQLDIACRKAGIPPGSPVDCSRFCVDRYA